MPRGKAEFVTMEFTGKGVINSNQGMAQTPNVMDSLGVNKGLEVKEVQEECLDWDKIEKKGISSRLIESSGDLLKRVGSHAERSKFHYEQALAKRGTLEGEEHLRQHMFHARQAEKMSRQDIAPFPKTPEIETRRR